MKLLLTGGAGSIETSKIGIYTLLDADSQCWQGKDDLRYDHFRTTGAEVNLQRAKSDFVLQKPRIDATEEHSLGYGDWLMNLRRSNKEHVLRLSKKTRVVSGFLVEQVNDGKCVQGGVLC